MKLIRATTFFVVLSGTLFSLQAPQVGRSDYEKLKTEAEKLYAEASYSLAHSLYSQASALTLPRAETRWVDFRLADTLWRSQAATETADTTAFDEAQQQLEGLVRDIQRVEDRDLVWAEVHESLGDFWWTRRDSRNWGQAWNQYQQALDWWAGERNIERARQRYLKIVWTTAQPGNPEPYYVYGYYGNVIPLEVLENALKISQSESDEAHAHYLIAMTLRQQADQWQDRQKVPQEFEAALKGGKATDWYDDALYHYAEWAMNGGKIIPLDDGQWRQEQDFVKGLELFRRLVKEYQKGETRYYDQAVQQIKSITEASLNVSVSNIFLPGSEIQFYLNWRNLKKVDLSLYRLNLTRDLSFSDDSKNRAYWIQTLDLTKLERIRTWTKDTGDKGDYTPGQEAIRLENHLSPGAYVVEARVPSGSKNLPAARDLILVSDASIVLKTSPKQALVYFCDVLDGRPLPSAQVKLWERNHSFDRVWRESSRTTNQDGIAIFELSATRPGQNQELYVVAAAGDRQAFSQGYSYGNPGQQQPWRIYAFTDRPAYRPGETVRWKFVARKYDGSVYTTPAQQTLEFEVQDPHGTKVKEGKSLLNEFGTTWGELELHDAMPLGEYHVTFWEEGRTRTVGQAALFRMEEYKLPEFKVSVQTPEESGKKKAFRLGDKIEATIQADYYFGSPVADANVEVLVYQNPFQHWYRPRHEFPWYYEDLSGYATSRYPGSQGQVIKRETIKTDAFGKVSISFDSSRNTGQDFEYRIEARVTDSSRREITASGTVRVTRQRYYVYPQPRRNLYRPQEKVGIDFKALDANDQPMEVEGRVKVTRDTWFEVWLDPNGREVKGEELRRLRERGGIFPPKPKDPLERPWRLTFQGYQHEDVLTRTVKTSALGEAEFTFIPEREGYYRISWSSQEKGSSPIQAETTVRVATGSTTELGYRSGGVEIIVDQDTLRPGQKAPLMLQVPTQDRYVLFSVEGEDLYSYQLVHLTGTAKLLELAIEEKHVPNIFLSAAMVSDRQLFLDTKQVVVPPVQQFLTVDLKPDREEYQPREEGTLTVTTRDHQGKPVRAELSLGLVDDSVYYIQQELAMDPRQFYFGSKRTQTVQTQSTFNQKSYVRLVEGKEKQLVDERERDSKDVEGLAQNMAVAAGRGEGGGIVGGAPGGVIGGVMRGAPASPLLMKERKALSASEAVTFDRADQLAKVEVGQEPAVQVRSDFRSTAFWQPDIVTDQQGRAIVKVKYPESLTSWKSTVRVATAGSQFGMASATTRTKQPLIVRLQAPRFFVVGDRVTVSAVINNNTDQMMTITPLLEAEGLTVTQPAKGHSGSGASVLAARVDVQANAERRVDWSVAVEKAGMAKLKVSARGNAYSDAMEKTYVVYEHGIEKFLSKSGKMRSDEVIVTLEVPRERRPGSTQLTLQVAPSLAVTMLDALPYLIDYPYGCTEQTMSRFLPAVITSKTLKDLGVQPETVMERVFGGIVLENAGKTQPKGKKDLNKLDEMVKQGLDRLYDFQHSDGGWGWWKQGESDHFMTAYVVWGLTLARDAGIQVKAEVLERGAGFLDKEIVEEEENYDQQAWMLHALAGYHASSGVRAVGKLQAKAFENLWIHRDKLNAYSRALLALSAHYYGDADKARALAQNLENGVKRDTRPDRSVLQHGGTSENDHRMGTAHWGEDGLYWRWSEGGVEATSFALRALLAIDPKNELIEPVTNWLIKNRRGAQWSNTRDTAITVLALNDYLRQSGELKADLEFELLFNGSSITTQKVTAAEVLKAPSRFAIDPKLVRDGANEIRILRKRGQGPLYFSAQAQFFSLEEPITAAGNEIFVRRQYFKLVPHPTLLKGSVLDRLPLNDGETVTSGERVEAVITVEAKNNYEYLVFEDLKPAGLEAVQIRSGESLFAREFKSSAMKVQAASKPTAKNGDGTDYTDRQRWVYQELRDRKVALFIDKLPQGVWEIRYDLRAEVPGQFHALPVLGHAMYVPEIRCNGTEVRLTVEDAKGLQQISEHLQGAQPRRGERK
jgi:alpha-2-macroglobulin